MQRLVDKLHAKSWCRVIPGVWCLGARVAGAAPFRCSDTARPGVPAN